MLFIDPKQDLAHLVIKLHLGVYCLLFQPVRISCGLVFVLSQIFGVLFSIALNLKFDKFICVCFY